MCASRQAVGQRDVDGDAVGQPRAVRRDDLFDEDASGVGSGRAVGDDAKLENSDAIWRSSVTCVRIACTQSSSTGDSGPPAIDVDAPGVLGRQLDRRQRVLDVVRDLPRHVRPRFEALRALELGALALEVVRHPVEVLDEPSQFVGRRHGDARVQVSARDAARRAGQAVDGIGDPLGHPVADAGAEEAEQNGAEKDVAIERRRSAARSRAVAAAGAR